VRTSRYYLSDLVEGGFGLRGTHIDSSNFFAAKSWLPSAFNASAMLIKFVCGRKAVSDDSWSLSSSGYCGGVVNKCSTELLVLSIGGAWARQPHFQPEYGSLY
jgi:hypothetical protein